MNESFHICMSHVTHAWVISHRCDTEFCQELPSSCCPFYSRHRSHVTFEGVMLPAKASSPMWRSHFKCEYVIWAMSHMKASCPMWRFHVPCDDFMSHVTISCPMWRFHVPCDDFMSHVKISYPMWRFRVPCEDFISHVKMSCPTWRSHVTCKGVMSQRVVSLMAPHKVGSSQPVPEETWKWLLECKSGSGMTVLDLSFKHVVWNQTCCSALQRVAVCCSVLQCGAVRCSTLHVNDRSRSPSPYFVWKETENFPMYNMDCFSDTARFRGDQTQN